MSETPFNPASVMPDPEPRIYTRTGIPARLGVLERILSLAVSAGCLIVLVIAAEATPSPTGMGTHRQLGLQPCGMLQTTGIPCPSCGMTTSFSWFARGNLLASGYVQPMGLVVAIGTALVFWSALYIAISGRPAYRLLHLIPARYTLLPLLLFGVAGWGWKIYIHLHGIDGWK